jgi:hypothetical protein
MEEQRPWYNDFPFMILTFYGFSILFASLITLGFYSLENNVTVITPTSLTIKTMNVTQISNSFVGYLNAEIDKYQYICTILDQNSKSHDYNKTWNYMRQHYNDSNMIHNCAYIYNHEQIVKCDCFNRLKITHNINLIAVYVFIGIGSFMMVLGIVFRVYYPL